MLDHLRHRILGFWSDGVTRHPYTVLAVSLLLAGLALWVTVVGVRVGQTPIGPLGFQSDRNDLLSKTLPWNQRFIRWQRTFEGMSDLWIIVDAWGSDGVKDEGEIERARALVDALGPALQRSPLVQQAVWGFDPTQVHPRAVRMLPMEEFEARMGQMREAAVILASATPQELLSGISSRMLQGAGALDTAQLTAWLASLRQLIDAMGAVVAAGVDEPVDFAALVAGPQGAAALRWQYLTDTDENTRHFYIRVTPVLEAGVISAAQDAIGETRRIMAEVSAHHPGVELGLTGVEVVEADETHVATVDSANASVLATVIITLLLIVAFHSWRVPLMAMASLMVGIAWSFGYVTLAIGHLQVLSIVFAVMLLGLGIAFGIHLAARYELIRHQLPDTSEGFMAAMRDTFCSVGPGMLTAAITTAAAFATMMFTDFVGLAEMGQIAAAGIMLCLVAMMTVFPALLRRYKRLHRHLVPFESRKLHMFEERWVMPFANHPAYTVLGIAMVTLLAGVAAVHVRFDYNLLNLVPRGVESIDWQRRLVSDGGHTLWYGVSIVDDLDEARRLTQAYRRLDTVSELGGVGLLFPPREQEKLAVIRQTRQALEPTLSTAARSEPAPVPRPAPAPPSGEQPGLIEQLTSFRFLMASYLLGAPPELRPDLERLGGSMDNVIATVNALPPDARQARLDRLDREYAQWRRQLAQQIDQALDESPLTIEELPAALRSLYYAPKDGVYALEIYPQLPEGLTDPLDPVFLARFVNELRTVDPKVTGASPQFYDSGNLIWTSFLNAGAYAVLAVFLVVLFDFGTFSDALLSMVPVVVGFIWTLGIMYLAGIDLNPANIIVLPLVFGIGVDSGVHMIHRYRQDPVNRPLGLTGGTGKGITITSLTAMIGFASMIPARHLGIRSLGITLTLGIGMILLACWILMPAWLEVRATKNHR